MPARAEEWTEIQPGVLQRRAGDYHRAAPGTVHDRIRSDAGCTLLVIESPA